MSLVPFNFHHLQYFWAVARDGNLTRAAASLRVAPSALSTQIRQLEGELDVTLFTRDGRSLRLTETGAVVFRYAERIFATGRDLVATVEAGRREQEALRIGSVATLSRNFQESFLKPLFDLPSLHLRLESGNTSELLDRLGRHDLDLVLANRAAPRGTGQQWRSRRVARQSVSIVGRPRRRFHFPRDLASARMLLPGPDSAIRSEFDALCEQSGIEVNVLAEIDDMATMRLLARDTDSLAVVPSVVVRDELRNGSLAELHVLPDVFETFYAIVVKREYQHPLVEQLFARSESEILEVEP